MDGECLVRGSAFKHQDHSVIDGVHSSMSQPDDGIRIAESGVDIHTADDAISVCCEQPPIMSYNTGGSNCHQFDRLDDVVSSSHLCSASEASGPGGE